MSDDKKPIEGQLLPASSHAARVSVRLETAAMHPVLDVLAAEAVRLQKSPPSDPAQYKQRVLQLVRQLGEFAPDTLQENRKAPRLGTMIDALYSLQRKARIEEQQPIESVRLVEQISSRLHRMRETIGPIVGDVPRDITVASKDTRVEPYYGMMRRYMAAAAKDGATPACSAIAEMMQQAMHAPDKGARYALALIGDAAQPGPIAVAYRADMKETPEAFTQANDLNAVIYEARWALAAQTALALMEGHIKMLANPNIAVPEMGHMALGSTHTERQRDGRQ